MFYHIALLTLSENLPADFDAMLERRLEAFQERCKGLSSILLRPNISDRGQGYTHGMISIFESSEAHDAYQSSEAHQELKLFMAPYILSAAFFDAAD